MKFVINEIRILAVQRSLLSLDASCWADMPALITNSLILSTMPWCFSAYFTWPYRKVATGDPNAPEVVSGH